MPIWTDVEISKTNISSRLKRLLKCELNQHRFYREGLKIDYKPR